VAPRLPGNEIHPHIPTGLWAALGDGGILMTTARYLLRYIKNIAFGITVLAISILAVIAFIACRLIDKPAPVNKVRVF